MVSKKRDADKVILKLGWISKKPLLDSPVRLVQVLDIEFTRGTNLPGQRA